MKLSLAFKTVVAITSANNGNARGKTSTHAPRFQNVQRETTI
ncbi:hypothetical protein [Polaromonas sp. CG9_12]|nr:hypothetical protein [Polaromonas sp. CG9_12]